MLSSSAICSGIGTAKADSVIATIPGLRGPLGVAFDSSNGNLYVSNSLDNTVSVISGQTNTVIGSIPVGSGPVGITFDSANGNLYVANFNGNTVSVISGQTNTVIGSPIPEVGGAPESIAFDSSNGNLYVANRGDSIVSVISGQTNTVIDSIRNVGHNPDAIAFDSANGDLYVASFNDNTVSVISGQTNTVIGSPIPVGSGPVGITFDSANDNVYVTNGNDNTVSVISGQTNTVIGSPIPAGPTPLAIAFNSANGNLYVTNVPNSKNNTVSVISGQTNTVIGSPIPVGILPEGIAFDSANDNVYVTNAGENTISVIATTPQHAPRTTITSVVDGNGSTITNGSTTFSSSIRFTFTATAGTNPVASFECSLDNSPFSSCSSPTTLTDLAAGKHTFQVRAVDTSGNRDPTPAIFSWTIVTITPPTKTTITATDGNNAPVQNGGTTSSSSITFTFTATQGSNPIAGFQCSLDNSPFSNCSSPATFKNLAAGSHKFAVVAVDTAGNKDPTPATFAWTISTSVTPTQSIQQLIQLKHSMHLNPTIDQTLDIRLNIALQFAQNNVKSGTCIQLSVFIKQVQAEQRVGQLSSVQSTQLIQGAQNIQTALGCTGSANGIVGSSSSAQSSLNSTQSQQQAQTSPSFMQPKSPYTFQYPYPFKIPHSQPSQAQLRPPTANAGISQTVNENTRIMLDGRASYAANGDTIVGYQWTQLPTGVPVALTGANMATPTFTAPVVPTDTVLAFSLRVMDSHGAVSTNPSIVGIMVKHYPNNGPTSGGNTPGTTIIQPQHQPLPNNLLPNPSQQNSRAPQIGSFQA